MGYKDVPDDYIYQKAIRFTQVQGIMSGVDDEGNFAPKGKMKLSELCVLIAHLFDFDYDSYRIKNSSEVPKWVFPYFMACRSYKVMPDSFENRIVLDEYATIDDLYLIFSLAQEHLIPLEFKSQFDIPEKASDSDLTRETCAYLLYHFCKSASKAIFAKLKQSQDSLHETVVSIYLQFKWIDFFYNSTDLNGNSYQIYYTLKRFPPVIPLQTSLATMFEIHDLRNSKFRFNKDSPVYHYTKLNTLQILTKPDATFHLSNTAYLNDPQEGKLALDILNDCLDENKYLKLSEFSSLLNAKDYSLSSCFIASFMKKNDSLPMWVQYGDNGAGCCIGIDLKNSGEDIFEVTYCKDDIIKFFTAVLDILNTYIDKNPEISIQSDPVFVYAKRILDQSCYLYKDTHYSHEHEVRIIRFLPLKSAKAKKEPLPGEIFPRVYCEIPIKRSIFDNIGLSFSSITLGPTVSKQEQIITALAQRGYNSSIVKQSEIRYR